MEVVKASLDRVEGNYAVVYSDSDRRKFDIPREILPKGIKPGNRVILTLDGDKVAKVIVDKKATEEARDRIKEKYEKLRRKRQVPGSD
jgi:bifunctional DNA-binding transcriptional regulator/antitoxin component of YhaV-PrlF toxin-antitoxin module